MTIQHIIELEAQLQQHLATVTLYRAAHVAGSVQREAYIEAVDAAIVTISRIEAAQKQVNPLSFVTDAVGISLYTSYCGWVVMVWRYGLDAVERIECQTLREAIEAARDAAQHIGDTRQAEYWNAALCGVAERQ